MNKFLGCFCIVLNYLHCDTTSSTIFHEGSQIKFVNKDSTVQKADYFGYSLVLDNSSLVVGAPKGTRHDAARTGLVFNCPLNLASSELSCFAIDYGRYSRSRGNTFFKDDVWFGATMVQSPNGYQMACAPRYQFYYTTSMRGRRNSVENLVMNGGCYAVDTTHNRGQALLPLTDYRGGQYYHQAVRINLIKEEYKDYKGHINFFAYGQAGFSVKAVGNHTFLLGAPGLAQWTGGIIDVRYNAKSSVMSLTKQPVANLYFTDHMEPDSYFGYSVDAASFEGDRILYVAGAPRYNQTRGQVFIFDPPKGGEEDPLNILFTLVGPQIGSYFGATLLCVDINMDGRKDLLVGAPNYVKKKGEKLVLSYDQGAVFVYMNRGEGKDFSLEAAGYIAGLEATGAKFGSSIADLGDLDEDGYTDVAIGAPWEENGSGAVYIYRGGPNGLRKTHVQRIQSYGTKGFGFSLATHDVDGNHCNDLAVGAYESATAHLFRCVPTMVVEASISVPGALDLPHNATNFTAVFCVKALKNNWPHVKIDLNVSISVDPQANRATVDGDPQYLVTIAPGQDACKEHTILVRSTANLSEPITLALDLVPQYALKDDSPAFLHDAARLSEYSTLLSTFDIQLTRDCGADLICMPWLSITMEPMSRHFVPGTDSKLGVVIKVKNLEEPAFGAKLNITLPLPPKRLPSSCLLEDMNSYPYMSIFISCYIPSPLYRMQSTEFEIELEYNLKETKETELMIAIELEDSLYRNISNDGVQDITLLVKPEATFTIKGKSLPNTTVTVTRERFYQGDYFLLEHYYEVRNEGPSDWHHLLAKIFFPDADLLLASAVPGCNLLNNHNKNLECKWSIPANGSIPLSLLLRHNLTQIGVFLESNTTFNSTTKILLTEQNIECLTTTTLLLEPAPPIWPLILGVVFGILLLAVLVYLLFKWGFFLRTKRSELRRLRGEKEKTASEQSPSPSHSGVGAADGNESTLELLSDTE